MSPPGGMLAKESFADMAFPQKGIDVSQGYGMQQPGTTPVGINVRTYEPTTNRARGGQRSGLSKYLPVQPNGSALIQDLHTLVGVGYTPPGGVVQSSSSGRVVSLIAVSGGYVYAASPGGTTWAQAANGTDDTPPLASSGIVRSTSLNQKLFFADGAHYAYYDPSINVMIPWLASDGSLPVDTSNNTPRLICTWRGRLVLAGLEKDPQNWFMSAVSDPFNWNYFPFSTSPAQAIAGNNSALGLIGDVVTTLIPYRDDVLVMGCDHMIWQFSGDPADGGRIDLVSDAIGMAWGIPWCKGPDGTLYFVSNRTGIYSMVPGQGPPQRISQQIEQLLTPIDTGLATIRLIWDDRFQGLHVFVTPTSTQTDATHFFYEARAGAWWMDTFARNAHNPLCCCVFDGNDPTDRRPLIGSWDGYVRSIDPDATTDDGTPILSEVILGPMTTSNLGDLIVKDIQGVLGMSSGDVNFSVYVGATAEIALSSSPVVTGTWEASRNLNNLIRRSGHAVYVRLSASNPWAMEQIRVRLAGKGKVRGRGR